MKKNTCFLAKRLEKEDPLSFRAEWLKRNLNFIRDAGLSDLNKAFYEVLKNDRFNFTKNGG
jgi:hypothetical protein